MHNIVAIVGRPNVGKSTLFNALTRRRMAIVDDIAGTTRDRISAEVTRDGLTVELIDTGGFEPKSQKVFWAEIRQQINAALNEADLIIFLADIRTGVTNLDMEISKSLHHQDKPVFLCINKADTMQLESGLREFRKLGWGEPLAISALQKRGLDDLWEKLRSHDASGVGRQAPETQDAKTRALGPTQNAQPMAPNAPRPLSIAIAGKRNVGKSTLVNNLAHEERTIVSEIPGTTRDAIDVLFEKDGQKFIAIDTAGVLKKKKLKDAVEIYSQQRTESAIRRADVVLFMIDARDKISEVDKKIANSITENFKPCVIAVNKWDLVAKTTLSGEYQEYLNTVLPAMNFAPIVFISAKTGFNVDSIIQMSQELYRQVGITIPTPILNKVAERIKASLPVAHRGAQIPKIYYVAQTGSFPPTITLMTNNRALFSDQALRYIQQQLRKLLPIHGVNISEVPINILLKSKHPRKTKRGIPKDPKGAISKSPGVTR
ncbi:MAG TPA: ribosome biogenesis GTPase Der [Planctomycetota bacterium]|nr:ribosome biogenesis GTPase Der [Planctomycetota bacterium]